MQGEDNTAEEITVNQEDFKNKVELRTPMDALIVQTKQLETIGNTLLRIETLLTNDKKDVSANEVIFDLNSDTQKSFLDEQKEKRVEGVKDFADDLTLNNSVSKKKSKGK
jgi:hypothetical protein